MEILIAGGILVALMVYVSTRIKKSAARAFERETVETDEFRLIKPEGFINPVNEGSGYLFEARSKDYGETDEARDVPQASFDLTATTGSDFETVCREAKNSIGKVSSEQVEPDTGRGQKICLLEGEETKSGVRSSIFHKIVESEGRRKIYDLKISVLADFRAGYDDRIGEILKGFSVK